MHWILQSTVLRSLSFREEHDGDSFSQSSGLHDVQCPGPDTAGLGLYGMYDWHELGNAIE